MKSKQQNEFIFRQLIALGFPTERVIKAILALHGTSIRSLAKKIGVSHTHVNQCISGKTKNEEVFRAIGLNLPE